MAKEKKTDPGRVGPAEESRWSPESPKRNAAPRFRNWNSGWNLGFLIRQHNIIIFGLRFLYGI